jgi:hypothetical protein
LFDMTTVYPMDVWFYKSHGVSDNRNAYISDGCFHIQNTQEPLFAKVASKSDTTIDSIITDAMNSVLIEVLIKRYQNANPISIPFQRLYNSYHVKKYTENGLHQIVSPITLLCYTSAHLVKR